MTAESTITIRLNGEDRTVASNLSVHTLLESLALNPELVVVERNREILGRNAYDEVSVRAGDVIEVVHFVGGG